VVYWTRSLPAGKRAFLLDERPARFLGHFLVEIVLGGSLARGSGLHGFLAQLLGEVVLLGSRNEGLRLLAFTIRFRALALRLHTGCLSGTILSLSGHDILPDE